MGRRKISIAPISDDRNRQVTFLKRKNGLFKKAYELGVLCSADVAVVVFNANGKLFEFGSGDLDGILLRYSHYAGPPHEKKGPADYINKEALAAASRELANPGLPSKLSGGAGAAMADDDDDDDDVGEEDESEMHGVYEGVASSTDRENSFAPSQSTSTNMSARSSKGKQAVVAAQAREQRSLAEQRHSSPDYSLFPQSTTSQDPSTSSSLPNSSAFPSTSSASTPSLYSLPPPSQPNFPTSQQQQQQHSMFFPPPPPNPAELFQLGLFGGSHPNSLPPSSSATASSQPNGPFNLPLPPGFPNPMAGQNMFGSGSINGFPAPQMVPGATGLNPFAFPNSTSNMNGANAIASHNMLLNGFNFAAPNLSTGFPNFFNSNDAPPTSSAAGGGGGGGSGGVPSWFGAPNPQNQMLAAAAALHHQHQAQQQYLQQQQQQQQQQQHEQNRSSASPHRTSSATPHDPASIERPTSTSSATSRTGGRRVAPPTRQDSTNSTASSIGGTGGGGGSGSSSRPRLNVAIPSASNAEEGRKAGLVTAGGASILGKGFQRQNRQASEGPSDPVAEDDDDDENSQPTAVPKSAFAADLLAAQSPFFPHPSHHHHHPQPPPSFPFSLPVSNSDPTHLAAFDWARSSQAGSAGTGGGGGFRPAPMLGDDERGDLIRDSPESINSRDHEGLEGLSQAAALESLQQQHQQQEQQQQQEEQVRRNLKRPSVDLEEGIEGLEVDETESHDTRKRRA